MTAAHSDFPLHISFAFLEKVRDSMEGTYKTNRNQRELRAYVLKEMDYFRYDIARRRELQRVHREKYSVLTSSLIAPTPKPINCVD